MVTEAQVATLEAANDVLAAAFKELGKQSKAVLSVAATEYTALETELQNTQAALAELQQVQANTEATSAEIAAAYDKAEKNLAAAKQALADVLVAIVDEVAAQQE